MQHTKLTATRGNCCFSLRFLLESHFSAFATKGEDLNKHWNIVSPGLSPRSLSGINAGPKLGSSLPLLQKERT